MFLNLHSQKECNFCRGIDEALPHQCMHNVCALYYNVAYLLYTVNSTYQSDFSESIFFLKPLIAVRLAISDPAFWLRGGLAWQVSGANIAAKPSEYSVTAFPQVPQHVVTHFCCDHIACGWIGHQETLALLKQAWHIWKQRPWQPARHLPQITMRAWLSRNLDHSGAGGGAQGTRSTIELASSHSLGLRELMEACAPLEKMVGKGQARPPVQSCCHQQETQVMLPSFLK